MNKIKYLIILAVSLCIVGSIMVMYGLSKIYPVLDLYSIEILVWSIGLIDGLALVLYVKVWRKFNNE